MKLKLPVIVTDRDGVIKRGSEVLPNANNTLSYLRSPLKDINPDKFKNCE